MGPAISEAIIVAVRSRSGSLYTVGPLCPRNGRLCHATPCFPAVPKPGSGSGSGSQLPAPPSTRHGLRAAGCRGGAGRAGRGGGVAAHERLVPREGAPEAQGQARAAAGGDDAHEAAQGRRAEGGAAAGAPQHLRQKCRWPCALCRGGEAPPRYPASPPPGPTPRRLKQARRYYPPCRTSYIGDYLSSTSTESPRLCSPLH